MIVRLRDWLLPALFVLLALPLCLVLAALIPPAESPDENVHVLRADSLLHGDLVGVRTAIATPDGPHLESLLHGDPGLTHLMTMFRDLPPDARKLTGDLRERLRAVRWGPAPDLYSAQTAIYPPVFYLPAALGLLAARWSGASPLDALVAARVANAVAYVLAGALALGLARRGRLLLFAMLALPMSLWLASAVHPDAPMLACFAIVVALASRWCASDGAPAASLWIGAVLLGWVIALKPPLFPTAGLLLLPLRRHAWPDQRAALRRGTAVALALVLGVGWAGFAQDRGAIPFRRGAPYAAGPLFPGQPGTMFRTTDPAAQLSVLLADPRRLATLPLRTMRAEAAAKAREAIGVLGQLDLPLPSWLYRLWAAALAAAAVGGMLACRPRSVVSSETTKTVFARPPQSSSGLFRGPTTSLPAKRGREWPAFAGHDDGWAWDALFIVAIAVACLFATYLALYLTWTPVGAERIEGAQGRYFLPLLALLGLALPGIRTAHAPAVVGGCAALITGILLTSIAVLPVLTVEAYYLR